MPGLENMSGTSDGALFSSKELKQGLLSPGSLQQSSQDLVAESSGPWKSKLEFNRDSESVVFNSGQKMVLRAVYVVIC